MHVPTSYLYLLQLSRTVAPDTSMGPALHAFMKHSNWRQIAILSSTESVFFTTRQGLAKQLEAASIKVLKPAAFEPGHVKDATLHEISRSGFRIILVLTFDADAQALVSLARLHRMARVGWAWLAKVGLYLSMAGGVSFRAFRPYLASDMQTFTKQVSEYSKSHFDITVLPDSVDLEYSVALFDAVMLYAHAATKVLAEGGDLHDGQAVTEAIHSTRFEGVGNSVVALDQHGNRIEAYEVMNDVVGVNGGIASVPVGLYNSSLQKYLAYERAVVWPGNTVDVPADYSSGDFFVGLLWGPLDFKSML